MKHPATRKGQIQMIRDRTAVEIGMKVEDWEYDRSPKGCRRIAADQIEGAELKIASVISQHIYNDDNSDFDNRYLPQNTATASRAFPWALMITGNTANASKIFSIDRFVQEIAPDDEFIYWVDSSYMKPTPLFWVLITQITERAFFMNSAIETRSVWCQQLKTYLCLLTFVSAFQL